MKVKYDGYENFDKQYGHIFYKKPFSYYLLKLEYRFVGKQAKGWWKMDFEEQWSNITLPSTMLKHQDFPISIEGPHCLNSTSKTYHGEQWVTAEFLAVGDSVIARAFRYLSLKRKN